MISPLLYNILIGCFYIAVLSWAMIAVQTGINNFKHEKRKEKKAVQDNKYHKKHIS